MKKRIYYLFGSSAVELYKTGMCPEDIHITVRGEYSVYAYNESEEHPNELLSAYCGWGAFTSITEEEHMEFYKLLNPPPPNETHVAWEMVEKYYPNYHSSDRIARHNDLCVATGYEAEEGSEAWKILNEQYGGDPENPELLAERDTVYIEILEKTLTVLSQKSINP